MYAATNAAAIPASTTAGCVICGTPLPAGGQWFFCGPTCEQHYASVNASAQPTQAYHGGAYPSSGAPQAMLQHSSGAPQAMLQHSFGHLHEQCSVASTVSSAAGYIREESTSLGTTPVPQRNTSSNCSPLPQAPEEAEEPTPTPTDEHTCSVCVNRTVASGTKYCSKRCSWLGLGKCPQCGRAKDATSTSTTTAAPSQVYCSNTCCTQAGQANWCSECGVRQIAPGSTHCSARCAASGTVVLNSRRRASSFSRHHILPVEDKNFQSLLNQYSHAMRVVCVVKLHSDAQRRKKFLNYRSSVESALQQSTQVGKYGHGGEGNEQRRLFPLSYGCCGIESGLGQPCGMPSCSVCVAMQHGFSMGHMSCGSHFCVSNPEALHQWCSPNAVGLKAFVVGRVVLGMTQFVANHSEVARPAGGFHSTVVDHSHNPMNALHSQGTSCSAHERFVNDDVCVFRDDAVDPQYLVLFC